VAISVIYLIVRSILGCPYAVFFRSHLEKAASSSSSLRGNAMVWVLCVEDGADSIQLVLHLLL